MVIISTVNQDDMMIGVAATAMQVIVPKSYHYSNPAHFKSNIKHIYFLGTYGPLLLFP